MTGPATRLRNQPLLLAEALLALALASVLITVLPFRSIARLAAGTGVRTYPPASFTEAQLIGRAVGAWAARMPWRAVCFQQGLAALLMLRRRRKATTLFYGAAHSQDATVVAHVWVRSGSVNVIGCETAGDYGLLATFPSLKD